MENRYNLQKVQKLHDELIETLSFIKNQLPCAPYPEHIKKHFKRIHWLTLPDTKLNTLKTIIAGMDTTSEAFDDLAGIIEYLRLKYLVKNYTSCIIKHEGRVPLKEVNGEWRFPNGQKQPTANIIINCKEEN